MQSKPVLKIILVCAAFLALTAIFAVIGFNIRYNRPQYVIDNAHVIDAEQFVRLGEIGYSTRHMQELRRIKYFPNISEKIMTTL